MKKLLFFLIFAFSILHSQFSIATVLSDAAAKLSPGQWAIVPMSNINLTGSKFYTGAGAPGPGYDNYGHGWDPVSRKIYMEVTEHGAADPGDCGKFPADPHTCWKPLWTYDEATDTWDVNGPYPNISGVPVPGVHLWNMTAWDQGNAVLYVRKYETYPLEVFRYCVNNTPSWCSGKAGTWTALPSYTPPGENCCDVLFYHEAIGKLFYYTGAGAGSSCGALFSWNEATAGPWTIVDPGTSPPCKFPTAEYALLGGYSRVKQVGIFGGGNKKFFRITNTGAISALDDAPCNMGTSDLNNTAFAEDPNTGNMIAVTGSCVIGGQMYQLDPLASLGLQWSLVDNDLSTAGKICNIRRNPNVCSWDFYAVPISTYGVIGYWKFRQGVTGGYGPTLQGAEFWIYKPSTAVGDTTPPTVSVTAPSGGATISGSSVTLTATASDNVGVAGVQFKVDGTNVGSEDTSSPYSITWNSTTVANGAHTITATARDAASNTTTSTGISVTVSNAGGGSDFTSRCNKVGVLFCNGFDSVGDLGGDGWGNARGHGPSDNTVNCGINNCPTIDTTVKVSGAGALKFTIPPGMSGARAGSYWANPSADFSVRFGANQTYYVQFRQRVTASYFPAILVDNGKIHWVSTTPDLPGCTPSTTAGGNCFASCSDNEFVNQNLYGVASDALPRWYNGCPGANTFEFIEPVTPGQYKLQNARTGLGCTYDNVNAGNRFPPSGNCFPYYPDQWVTYSYKISLGSLGTGGAGGRCYDAGNPGSITPNLQNCYYGSQIQARMGLDGQPLEEVLNWTLPVIAKDQTNPTELKYGKVWFSPYTGTATIPSGAAMWFDELIISTTPIDDPGAGGGTVSAPTAIRISGGY